MNNFNNLLERKLEEVETEDRLNATVSFEISIPISNYKDKGDTAKDYAKRDTDSAVEAARKKIIDVSYLGAVPLNVKILAFLKKQTIDQTIFDVHVEGGDETFLLSLIDLM